MHAHASKRIARKLTVLISAVLIAACGTGDGPETLPGTPATPLPPIPPGFCDVINFEVLCPPVTIINFNGGATTIIDNPDMSGINTSDLVAQMQKFPDQPFGGTKLDLGAPIDFAPGEAFTVKVWSPRGVALTFKLDEQNKERVQNHSGSGTWEELCFDFSGDTAGAPNPGLTLIFDNGTLGQADTDPANWTFFYDDIAQVANCGGGGGPAAPDLPVDFENAVDAWFSDFDGGVANIEANPDMSGINISATVARMRKFAGEVWAGSTLALGNPVDFGLGDAFTVKVWASRQVPMTFKLEGLNQELVVNHTGSGTWEELCFDFTGLTAGPDATAISFIFELGVAGDAAGDPNNWTFFIDDVAQAADCGGGGGPPAGGTPITPENVVFATDPNVVVDLPPPVIENFGSGAVFDFTFAGDPDYNPALQITSGEGYGAGVHVGFIALTGYAPGFAANYENFVFKVKGDAANLTSFEVKFIEGGDTSVLYDLTTYSGAEDLGNGWLQVSIPMTDFVANIAANAGFLLGPAGGQAGPFTQLLTDIGFTGNTGGSGGTPITPEAVVFATDPNITEDLAPPGVDNFGSGAVFDFTFAGDADFNPSIQTTSGEGYGAGVHVAFVAFTGYAAGFADGYENFVFKVKGDAANLAAFEVKFIGGTDTSVVYDLTSYSGSESLGNGWWQVSIPMTDFAANIAVNNGFLLGPLGGQAAPFSFLMTDLGFTGNAGGGASITPDNVVFATDPNVTEDLAPAGVDNFGSGAVFDFMFAGDADYNPAVQATSGEGYGAGVHVAFVAFTGYAGGFASTYENFVFKVKGDAANLAAFEVKFIGGTDTSQTYDLTNYSGSVDLGNGWWQVSIPMSDFAANIAVNDGFLLGPLGGQAAPFSFLMTDIGFTGTGGGGNPPVGDGTFVNGDFEAGDFTGWTQTPDGGSITLDTSVPGGRAGTVARLVAAGSAASAQDVLLSQVDLVEINSVAVTGGASVTVSVDVYGSLSGAGGVVFIELISRNSLGEETGRSFIGPAPIFPDGTWTTHSSTVNVAADVSGGVTLQLKSSCGPVDGCGVDAYFDDVTMAIN